MSLVHNCFSSKRRRGEFQDIRTRGGGGVGFRETDHEGQNGPAHEPNFTHQPLTTRSRPSTRGQFQRPGTMLIPSMMQANSTLPPGPYYSWPGHRDAVPPRGTNVAMFGVRLFKKKKFGVSSSTCYLANKCIPFFSHQVTGPLKIKQPIPQVKQSYSSKG